MNGDVLVNSEGTRSRPQILSDGEWYACTSFQESHRWMDVDQGIVSHCPVRVSGRGEQEMITVRRGLGEPDFSRRERLLIRCLHHELAPLVGPSSPRPTSRRPRN